ncbi:MAG: hypothetical protein ACRD82_22745 [Blastocatellia bacterium]
MPTNAKDDEFIFPDELFEATTTENANDDEVIFPDELFEALMTNFPHSWSTPPQTPGGLQGLGHHSASPTTRLVAGTNQRALVQPLPGHLVRLHAGSVMPGLRQSQWMSHLSLEKNCILGLQQRQKL